MALEEKYYEEWRSWVIVSDGSGEREGTSEAD